MAEVSPQNGNSKPGGTAKRPPVGTGKKPPVGTGKRPAVGTASHAAATGAGGGRVVLLVMFMVMAGLVGGGLAFKDQIFPPKKPPVNNDQHVVKPPPVIPKPPDVAKPPDVVPKPPDVHKPPDVPLPPATPDNGLAQKAIADGKDLIAKINYPGALKAFGSVEVMKVSPELAKEAAALAKKAEAFDKLTRDIKARVDAGQTISILELADGKKLRGVVTKKPDGSYSILTGTAGSGQMSLTLQAADVRDIKEISPAERRAELNQALTARLSRLGAMASAPEVFEVAVFAVENGLREESLPILERAWDAAAAAKRDLLAMVAEDQASKLFAQANWSDSIGQEIYARRYCEKIRDNAVYQKTSFFEAAEKMLAMMDQRKGIKYVSTVQIVEVRPPDPVRPPPTETAPVATEPVRPPQAATVTVSKVSSKVDLSEANRVFEEGMNHYVRAMPGMPDCKSHQSEARRLLRKAQELYEAAVKADPSNDQLQSRMTDCNMRLYGIMKMSTL